MKETHEFLVPDYYPEFACKMGACRHACCDSWPVTISLNDYFHMMNIDCDPALQDLVCGSLRILPSPTPQEYAEIAHDYLGRCRLRMDDGRCRLHAEAGEDALSPLCRLFPRGVRAEGDYECSCALSCEATLELLYARREPLRFIHRTLTIDVPGSGARSVYFETVGREQEIRLYFIALMQDRRFTLPQRLENLTRAIGDMEQALNAGDGSRVDACLKDRFEPRAADTAPTAEMIAFGLSAARRLIGEMDARSSGLREYGQHSLDYFGTGAGAVERYAAARTHFEERFPMWHEFFEHMLVNHMFFARFPFQDRPDSLHAEKLTLDSVYCLLRFTALGCMAESDDPAALIDVCRAVFHLVDHTSFDRYAGLLLDEITEGRPEAVRDMLLL